MGDDDIFFNQSAARGRILGGLNFEEPFAQEMASRQPLIQASGGLGAYQNAYDQQVETLEGLFDKANEALRARMGGGESKEQRMERLLTLAAALGQPTRTGSFGEQLSNFNTALVGTLRDRRERKEELADALAKNEQAKAMTLAKLKMQYLMQAAKPKTRRTGFNPVTGELTYLDTGEPVPMGGAGVEAPDTLPADYFDGE